MAQWVAEQGWTDVPVLVIERPSERGHGDYATPFAMQAAGVARRPPREVATALRDRLLSDPGVGAMVEGIDIAGPGFLNFRLAPGAFVRAAAGLLDQGEEVGHGTREHPLHILLEYVSVNPNGPLHVGHGRYAAYGNALDRLLSFSGHRVSTEFYVNDYGRQMDMFGRSVAARYAQSFGLDLPVPEEGLPRGLRQGHRRRHPRGGGRPLARDARGRMASTMRRTRRCASSANEVARSSSTRCGSELAEFRVTFDRWFSETVLHEEGRVTGVIDHLLQTGEAYRKDEAVWLRTTAEGDDKDRVLIRSNDAPTYFAADIAYHQDKISRGYDHLINIWGADHHGYVPRMKAAVAILSHDPDMLEVIIGQLVNLTEGGEQRQMSTRRGEMVTLRELIDAIGVDAARFFLVMRSQDQAMDLDIDLAREQSQENPVYYVQYAHARIASITRRLTEGLEAVIDDQADLFDTPLRAGSDQEARRVRGGGAGRRRSAGAPPHRRVCPGGLSRLPCLLQAVPRHRLRARGGQRPTRPVPRGATGDRALSRSSGSRGARGHVARAPPTRLSTARGPDAAHSMRSRPAGVRALLLEQIPHHLSGLGPAGGRPGIPVRTEPDHAGQESVELRLTHGGGVDITEVAQASLERGRRRRQQARLQAVGSPHEHGDHLRAGDADPGREEARGSALGDAGGCGRGHVAMGVGIACDHRTEIGERLWMVGHGVDLEGFAHDLRELGPHEVVVRPELTASRDRVPRHDALGSHAHDGGVVGVGRRHVGETGRAPGWSSSWWRPIVVVVVAAVVVVVGAARSLSWLGAVVVVVGAWVVVVAGSPQWQPALYVYVGRAAACRSAASSPASTAIAATVRIRAAILLIGTLDTPLSSALLCGHQPPGARP